MFGLESKVITVDEFPKPSTTYEALERLRPAFIKDGTGSVTAGNASGINDGAAAVLISDMCYAKSLNLKEPLARIASWAQVGLDPSIMGTGPIGAVKKAVRSCFCTFCLHVFI